MVCPGAIPDPWRVSDQVMRRLFLAMCILALAAVAGCAGPRYQAGYFADDPGQPYTLAAGDRLRIIVFSQDTLSNSYAVDGSGHISMPLIGLVAAQGRSTHDLEREIETKLRGGFLREPKVSVEVEAFRPFFVLGEITTAGQYPYVNGMTIQNAIAIAGGYTPRAEKGRADLTRVIDGYPTTYSVPAEQPVRPGDTVTVRERFF
jgi:polysaccharide export outer membrane protein